MLASFDDAEDAVQDTFLRAWRGRAGLGEGQHRAWLYRIATNVCLDALRRHRPRAVLDPSGGSSGPSVAAMPWLQPYPDALLDELVSDQPDPETRALTRESISLAYLTVIQLLAAAAASGADPARRARLAQNRSPP